MHRESLSDLKYWYNSKNRKPLVIRGARQVGKSTLIRLFVKELGLTLIEINFEKVQLKSLKNPTQVDLIIQEIELKENIKIDKNCLLFFDEIQKYPEIFQSLRYFFEENYPFAVVAAGSLLEFILENPDYDVPVGRIQYYFLGPVSFNEFLIATGKSQLHEKLRSEEERIPAFMNELLESALKDYFFVGGMPQAVQAFIDSGENPKDVSMVHQSIIQTYKDDFNKYANRRQLPNLGTIFEKIPNHIGHKLKYSELDSDLSTREIKESLELLKRAGLITYCYHSNCSGLPLRSQKNYKIFKLYFLDLGLMNAIHGIDWIHLHSSDLMLLTKGVMAEQFVAQHLTYLKGGFEEPELFYWLRDQEANKAEVDFVVVLKSNIVPIEVKSGSSGSLKSLTLFAKEKKSKIAYRLDTADEREASEDKQNFTLRNFHLSQAGSLK
jgi:predicted AAA+ superfamily ATPase